MVSNHFQKKHKQPLTPLLKKNPEETLYGTGPAAASTSERSPALHFSCQIKKIKSHQKKKKKRKGKGDEEDKAWESEKEGERAGLKGRLHGEEHKNTVS